MMKTSNYVQSKLALAFVEGAIERIREGGEQAKFDYAYAIGAITAYAMLGIIEIEQSDELRQRAYDALTIIQTGEE